MFVQRRVAGALTLALLLVVTAGTAAQRTRLPRTPWGDPDLQGTWPAGPVFAVPFERDPAFGTRAVLSPEEAARRNAEVNAQYADVGQGLFPELGNAPPATSLVVEPENGRLPPMTDEGARRAAEWRLHADPDFPAAGPEELRPYDRCISRGVLGSTFPNLYSSGMQIHQAPGVVVVRYEMVHEARAIPLDRRPHPLVHGRRARHMGG
jgi:hypothetical protein